MILIQFWFNSLLNGYSLVCRHACSGGQQQDMKNKVPRFVRDFNKVLAQILRHLLWCYVWNPLAPFEKTHGM